MAPRKGGNRQQSRKAVADGPSPVLAEARKLKQQAERKPEGSLRDPVLKRSAELFENALALPLSRAEQEEAWFDLGEVFLLASGSLQAGLYVLAGNHFKANLKKPKAMEIQLQTFIAAATMSRKSHEIFERVQSMEGTGELKEEAAVNSGNALCDWAELALEIPREQGGGVDVATELYSHAYDRYYAALQSSPEDVELLTNVGDCCIQRAELAASSVHMDSSGQPSGWDLAKDLYERGLSAYAGACANADARVGDDLAGLLQNWGVGLFSVAQRSPDQVEAMRFSSTAKEKLQSAMKFRKTDLSVCLALGEGLVGVAEYFAGKSHWQQQQQVLELLKVAVNDGYEAVLKIDSKNVSALLGMADAHLSAAKLLSSLGNDPNAVVHLQKSLDAYSLAVKSFKEESEGEYNMKFEERCDALYNLACVAALSGKEQEACEALGWLASIDALSITDLIEDSDLAIFREKDWFISIVQSTQNEMIE